MHKKQSRKSGSVLFNTKYLIHLKNIACAHDDDHIVLAGIFLYQLGYALEASACDRLVAYRHGKLFGGYTVSILLARGVYVGKNNDIRLAKRVLELICKG